MPNPNNLPVVVYSTPGCQQCNLTKNWLESHKIQYRDVNLEEDAVALQKVRQMGYQAAPVVIVPFDWPTPGAHWYGFRPDKLQALIEENQLME